MFCYGKYGMICHGILYGMVCNGLVWTIDPIYTQYYISLLEKQIEDNQIPPECVFHTDGSMDCSPGR